MEQTISIEKILKELYHISGFRISVYDTYFQEIAAFPKELGCLCSLIQENPAHFPQTYSRSCARGSPRNPSPSSGSESPPSCR